MIATAVALRLRGFVGEASEDGQLAAKRFQGLQDGREFKARALGGGSPLVHDCAVRNVHKAEASLWTGCGLGGGCQSRDHGVEQGQRDGAAYDAAQKRAARQMLFQDHHCWFDLLMSATDVAGAESGSCERLIWNGVLSTIPKIKD